MTRRTCTFRQRDVTAAIKAAVAGGLQIGRVEVSQDGRIVLISEKAAPDRDEAKEANEWDLP
jgi:hypothetical protein